MLSTFTAQLVFDCKDHVRCVRTAAITQNGRCMVASAAPQPIGISLNKKSSLCTSVILRCPYRSFCHLCPQKIFPKVFVFCWKCLWWKDHKQRVKYIFAYRSSEILFYFLWSCCTLIGITRDCVLIEFYKVATSPPSAWNRISSLQEHNFVKQKNWVM